LRRSTGTSLAAMSGLLGFLSWFDDADRLRGRVGQLVNCEARDIAFINSANSALSLLMGGLGWKPGDRIVALQD